jgi:hypothetical protein
MFFKLKYLTFVVLLSFVCPLDFHDTHDCSMNSGQVKHLKKLQIKIKDKRGTVKSENRYLKNTAEFIAVYCLTTVPDMAFRFYCFTSSEDFTLPAIKYAVWSKSTFC